MSIVGLVIGFIVWIIAGFIGCEVIDALNIRTEIELCTIWWLLTFVIYLLWAVSTRGVGPWDRGRA